MGFYASEDDIRSAFDSQTLQTLYNLRNESEISLANPKVALDHRMAHAQVTSNLAPAYGESGMPSELPASVSQLLVAAELAYLRYYGYLRKPELAAKISDTFLKDLWKSAEGLMDRIKDSIQIVAPTDNPPPPPATVGGVTYDRGPKMLTHPEEPCDRSDFGDF